MLFRALCCCAFVSLYFPGAWAASYSQIVDSKASDIKAGHADAYTASQSGFLDLLGAENESMCRSVIGYLNEQGGDGAGESFSWFSGNSVGVPWIKVGEGWVEYFFAESKQIGRHVYRVRNVVRDEEVHQLYVLKKSIHDDEELLSKQISVCNEIEPKADCHSPDKLVKYAINSAIKNLDQDIFDGPFDLVRMATGDDASENMIYSKSKRKALRNVGRYGGVRWQAYKVEGEYYVASFPVSGFSLPEILIFKLGRDIELKCVAIPNRWN